MSFFSRSLPAPTADELARWDAIKRAMQCVACFAIGPVEIHHLLSGGGLRLGHRYTVSLCRFCHAAVKTRTFKARHTNQYLMDATDKLIDWCPETLPSRRERNRKSKCTTKRALPRRYGP